MAINYTAENCVLEIGEVVGTKEVTNTTQVGTTSIITSVGCKDNIQYSDQGFNSGLNGLFINNVNQRVVYTGYMPSPSVNVGGSLQEMVGIGNTSIQGCQLTYLNIFGNREFRPGTNTDDNKIVYLTAYSTQNPYTQINFPSNNPQSNAGGARFFPRNSVIHADNIQGRAIYFVNENSTSGSGNNVTRRNLSCFDIIASSGSDMILRGNGSDTLDDYSLHLTDLWNDPEGHTFYISAYKHSAAWDSSGGSNTPFHWIGGSLSHNTSIGSYEGSIYRDANLGVKQNDCFTSPGLLGLTNVSFGSGAGGSADQYEVEIRVSQIINATIDVLEGQPYNNNITSLYTQNDLQIKDVGTYTFCLAALKRTDIFGQTMTNGGVTMMDNGTHFHSSNGSVNLINAKAIDRRAPARCTVDYIKITRKDTEFQNRAVPNFITNTYNIDDIEWNFLDILKNNTIPLALTFQINNLNDLTKQNAAFSKTFTIPANKHNCRVLDPMLAVGSERVHINWQPCRVSVDSVVIFKGLIRVEKGITGKGGFFSCHIVSDSIDWANLLDNKKICELAFSTENKKNHNNIVSSWDNTADTDSHIYGLINYGEWNAPSVNPNEQYIKNNNDFHPAIFAYKVTHQIFEDIGYVLDSEFIESETFKKLVIPYTSGEDYMENDLYDVDGGHSCSLALFNKTTCGGNFDSGGKCPPSGLNFYTTRYTFPAIVEGFDNGNNFSTNTVHLGYVVPFTSNYDISISGTLYVAQDFRATSLCHIRLEVLRNGQSMSRQGHSYLGGQRDVGESGIGDGLSVTDNAIHNLNANDNISVKITVRNYSAFYSMWCDHSDLTFDIFPVFSSTAPEVDVNLTRVLPCTDQKTYLKGITELFNLQWIADKETKTVKCEPYNSFFGSGKVVDWTNKLDRTSWTDKFIAKDLAQNVKFKYKVDSGDNGIESLAAWREDNNLDEYKSYEIINLQRFKKETLELGTTVFHSTYRFNNYGLQPNPLQQGSNHPVAPNAYAWGDLTWTNPVTNSNNPLMPVIWTEDGGHINGFQRPPYKRLPKAGIRILNYYGKTDCARYVYKKESGQNVPLFEYPYLDWINGWQKGIAIDDYNLSWNDFDDGHGNVSPGLFTKYWKNSYNKISGGAAIRTCNIALSPVDINLFDYRDIVHLKIDNVSTYWTVHKIKDFKPGVKQLTSVELIEWRYDSNYATPSLIQNKIAQPEGQLTLRKSELKQRSGKETPLVREKTNLEKIDDALRFNRSGELELYGGELIVEEDDGSICHVVYTDDEDIRKLYLEADEIENIYNTNSENNEY